MLWSWFTQPTARVPVRRREPKPTSTNRSGVYKIVVVLDESSSMSIVRSDIVTSLNKFIDEQKRITGRTFTLVKFSDAMERTINRKSLSAIQPLSYSDYVPNGNTALYDAIGDTIEWFGSEDEVLLVIVTDGQENASRSFRREEVLNMIEEKKRHNGWSYVYLSNDLQTCEQGNKLGLYTDKMCSNVVLQQADFGCFIGEKLNKAVSGYRSHGISVQSQL
jgi:hypothetical protein